MATHSNIRAWRIPWTEEPGGLKSMGSQRVRHYRSNRACMHKCPIGRRRVGSDDFKWLRRLCYWGAQRYGTGAGRSGRRGRGFGCMFTHWRRNPRFVCWLDGMGWEGFWSFLCADRRGGHLGQECRGRPWTEDLLLFIVVGRRQQAQHRCLGWLVAGVTWYGEEDGDGECFLWMLQSPLWNRKQCHQLRVRMRTRAWKV